MLENGKYHTNGVTIQEKPRTFGMARRQNYRLLLTLGAASLLAFLLFSRKNTDRGTLFDSSREIQLSRLINVGLQLLEKAGRAVVEHRTEGEQAKKVKGMTKEGKKEFVTQGDLKSHRIIVGNLERLFPGLNVVSEEHDRDFDAASRVDVSTVLLEEVARAVAKTQDLSVPLSDVTVWIDPLDATQEYTELLDQYVTVMICVVVGGVPLAGLMHFPFEGVTYWQWRYHYVSKSLLSVMQSTTSLDAKRLRIVVSRSHAGKVNETLRLAFGKAVNVIPAGGAGYKVMQLLRGKADLYVHTTAIKKWDICVGDSMLRHVNGKMTTLTGKLLDYGRPSDYKVKDGLLAAKTKEHFGERLDTLKKLKH